jgi:hypothetical protein
MTEVEVFSENGGDVDSVSALSPEEIRRRRVALSARVGVWGIIGGLGAFIASPILYSIGVGSVLPSPVLTVIGLGIASASFGIAGLGTMATSVLVMKDLKRASWPLKLASIVGLPFGLSLALGGFGALLGLPPLGLRLPFWLMSLTVPAGMMLGVTLMILLLAGFFSHAFFNRSSTWED